MNKTITLHGRGNHRYPIVPGVWAHCLAEAAKEKSWAAEVTTQWMSRACGESLRHLTHVHNTDVETLAREGYRYLEMRAHLRDPQTGQGDGLARSLWLKLGGKIRRTRRVA